MVVPRGLAGPQPTNGLLPAGTPWEEIPDAAAGSCDAGGAVVVVEESGVNGALRLLGLAAVVGGLVVAYHLMEDRENSRENDELEEWDEMYPEFDDDFDFDDEDDEDVT